MTRTLILLALLLQPLCGARHGSLTCGEELGHLGRHVAVTASAVIMWGQP